MSKLERGRTTRDGNLELVPKPEPSQPEAAPAPSPDRGGQGGGAGQGGGGNYGGGGGGYGGAYRQLDPLATASLVCGVLGILMICCCGLFTLLLAPLAIVMGIASLVRIKNDPERLSGVGMAWAGIATGAVALGFYLLYFALWGGVQLLDALGEWLLTVLEQM